MESDNATVNNNRPGTDLAAEIQLSRMRVHRAVSRRILELAECGSLDDHAIAAATGYPVALIRLVMRGGNSTAAIAAVEK